MSKAGVSLQVWHVLPGHRRPSQKSSAAAAADNNL